MTLPQTHDAPAQPERRYSPVSALIAWIVMVLVVGFIVAAVTFPELRGKKPGGGQLDAMNTDLTLRLTVGEHEVFKCLGAMSPQVKTALVNQIQNLGNTDADSLRVAAIIGEVEGKDAALRHMDKTPVATTLPTTSPATGPVVEQADAMRKIYVNGVDSLTPQERTSVESLGFAGKLALNFSGEGRASPPQIVLDERNRFVGVIAWFVLMSLLSISGLVLAIIAIVMLSTGSLKLAGLPLHVPGIPFVEVFAIYLVLFFAGQLLLAKLNFEGLLPSIGLIVLLVPIFYYVFRRGVTWPDVLAGFGWTTGNGVVREIGAGIVGYIAGLPLLIAGFTLAILLMRITGSKPSHPITQMVGGTPWWLLYLLASVWAPIFEETMFRGALLQHLRRGMPWLGAAPIVSLIFAMIHPQGLAFIPALGAIAMMLAALREWRGSIIAPMVAHGLSNAATITLLLIMLR